VLGQWQPAFDRAVAERGPGRVGGLGGGERRDQLGRAVGVAIGFAGLDTAMTGIGGLLGRLNACSV
jgi:hypothetical protein